MPFDCFVYHFLKFEIRRPALLSRRHRLSWLKNHPEVIYVYGTLYFEDVKDRRPIALEEQRKNLGSVAATHEVPAA
jgi:hypothetical protein